MLPRDDDFEFNPFDWAQASAQAHSQTLQELAELKSRASSEQGTITRLNAQLDDFIKTKNESETAMLQQFMELLNEKKRKIRDQSRLLAGAKVDKSVGMLDVQATLMSLTCTKQPLFNRLDTTPSHAKQLYHGNRSGKPQHKQQSQI